MTRAFPPPEYAARNKRYTRGTNQPKQTYSRIPSRTRPGYGGRTYRSNFFASTSAGVNLINRKRNAGAPWLRVSYTYNASTACAITSQGFFYTTHATCGITLVLSFTFVFSFFVLLIVAYTGKNVQMWNRMTTLCTYRYVEKIKREERSFIIYGCLW